MAYDSSNIFARILRGEAPCIRVHESAAVLAFMDVMPQSDGHVLVLPKEAAATIFELSPAALAACTEAVRRIALAINDALRPDGLTIAQFNGAAAGQTVAHVHFHLVPRWAEQPLRPHGGVREDEETLRAFAQRIRTALEAGTD